MYRPDLLPFALPTRIGLPYHGIATADKLTLPDSTTMDYHQPIGGETTLVEHPRATTPAPDTNAKHLWQNYALLSGAYRSIGGQDLGPAHWLYCDANYTWVVSVELSTAGLTQTLDVWLEDAFGILPAVVMDRRKLATYTYTPKRYDGTAQTSADAAYARSMFLSHDKTGALSMVNVGAINLLAPWNRTTLPYSLYSNGGGAYRFHDALRVDISGNGSIAKGLVGTGITATITHYQDATTMVLQDSVTSSTAPLITSVYLTSVQTNFEQTYPPTIPCPGPTPDGRSLGYTSDTRELFLCDALQVNCAQSIGGDSTVDVVVEVAYLPTVTPDSAIHKLEITFASSAVDTMEGSSGGSMELEEEYFWWDCVASYTTLNYVTTTLTGSFNYTASRAYHRDDSVTVSWCGSTTTITLSADSPLATNSQTLASTMDSFLTANVPIMFPAYSDYTYLLNGVETDEAFIYGSVANITNNLFQVAWATGEELLTILGDKELPPFTLSTDEASLNPKTGDVEYRAGGSVCWV